jgi:HSP20 family molecular chaperone IbpA
LESDVDVEAVSAELKNGVLTVTLPKSEKVKPRKIAINVTSEN